MRAYIDTLRGWSFVDLPISDAKALMAKLVEEGAGFCHTSEPAIGRRIYFISPTSQRIVRQHLHDLNLERETHDHR